MTTIYVCVEVFPSHILKSDNRISYTISWRGKTSVTMTCTSISLPFSFPSFTIFFLSINRDALSGLNTSTIRVLDKFNYKFDVDYDDDDIKVIQYATALVSFRAALLVSICTAVLLNRMNEKEITIAVDGSVYKHHPRLKTWMKQLIKEFAPEKEVSVFLHIPIGKFSIPWCYWLPFLSLSSPSSSIWCPLKMAVAKVQLLYLLLLDALMHGTMFIVVMFMRKRLHCLTSQRQRMELMAFVMSTQVLWMVTKMDILTGFTDVWKCWNFADFLL